jgi:hypothetical protein
VDIDSQPELVNAAFNSRNAYYIHYKFLYDNGDESPEKFVGSVVKSIFNHRHQLSHKFAFCADEFNHGMIKILDIKGGGSDVSKPLLKIPNVTKITDMEKIILKGIENYIDPSRSTDFQVIDTDLDSYGMLERNKILFIGEQRITKESMSKNPLERFYRASGIDARNRAANIRRRIRQNIEIHEPSVLVGLDDDPNNNSSSGEGNEENEENEDAEEDENGSGEEGEEENEEYDIDVDDEQEDIDPFDDSKYQDRIGYFMGRRLDRIFMQDVMSVDMLSADNMKRIYERLNAYKPPSVDELECMDSIDVDFKMSHYVISKDPETGEPVYHWDLLAKEELYKRVETGGSIESCSFIPLVDEDLEGLTHEEKNRLKFETFIKNAQKYKLICTHPSIVEHFINNKHYKDSKFNKYPRDMLPKTKVQNRAERWTNAKTSAVADQDIINSIQGYPKSTRGRRKETNQTKFNFNSYTIKDGQVVRDPKNQYCIVGNVFNSLENIPSDQSSQSSQERNDESGQSSGEERLELNRVVHTHGMEEDSSGQHDDLTKDGEEILEEEEEVLEEEEEGGSQPQEDEVEEEGAKAGPSGEEDEQISGEDNEVREDGGGEEEEEEENANNEDDTMVLDPSPKQKTTKKAKSALHFFNNEAEEEEDGGNDEEEQGPNEYESEGIDDEKPKIYNTEDEVESISAEEEEQEEPQEEEEAEEEEEEPVPSPPAIKRKITGEGDNSTPTAVVKTKKLKIN